MSNHNPPHGTICKLSHLLILTAYALITPLACGTPTPDDGRDMGGRSDAGELTDLSHSASVRLRRCVGAALPGRATEPWRKLTSGVVARGEPSHALHDVITTRDRDVDIVGHVTYGLFERELEGEVAELYIHDCEDGFALLSRTVTRRDGVARFIITEQDVPFHGEYELLMRIPGDNSTTRATLRVLPTGTRLVVLDVDELLTRDSIGGAQDRFADLFEPVGLGDHVPEPRPGAVHMTNVRATQGYELLYLTPRPHDLTTATRQWLEAQGFAPGTLWFADTDEVSLSWNISAYKRGVLQRMLERGYLIDAAYGAHERDVQAYREVGIPTDHIWTVGRDVEGATFLGNGFHAHNAAIEQDPIIAQPFERTE